MSAPRLLELLALLQSRRFWPGNDLAERLAVTPRTVRRDVEKLRELGYEVEATSGPGGGYRFGTGSVLPPILLSEDEAVMVTVAVRTAVEDGGERVLPVLAKLDQLLPERLRARVAAVNEQTVQVGRAGPGVDLRTLTQLASACRDGEAVRIRYRAAGRAAEERVVHPLRLASTGNRRWYLVAWDPAREGWRTLRVDRVEAILAIGPRVTRPEPPADLARYVSESIAAAPYRCRATFELRGTFDELSPRVHPWIGVLTASGPGVCTLDVGGPDWIAVVSLVMQARTPFRVVAPPEAVEACREAGALLIAAAG